MKSPPISPSYRKPIFKALGLQALISILSTLLDGGVTARICVLALIAFWCGALILISRRPNAPTPTDLALIRLPVVAITLFFVYLIWIPGAR